MDLSNDLPIKTNNKLPDNLKYEYEPKIIDEFIVLLSKTYNFRYYAKQKGEKEENRAIYDDK